MFSRFLSKSTVAAGRTSTGRKSTSSLSTEHGFCVYLNWAAICRGWLLASDEQEGLTVLRERLAATRAAGSVQGMATVLLMLVDAYTKPGRAVEGMELRRRSRAIGVGKVALGGQCRRIDRGCDFGHAHHLSQKASHYRPCRFSSA